MKDIIERFKQVVVQIATPHSTGTGFYLKKYNLIVTNEHVVRDNNSVVIEGTQFPKQLSRVLFSDPKHDLAFLEVPESNEMPNIPLAEQADLTEGDLVIAIGHPFGLKYTATQGIVSNLQHHQHDIDYIQHDAALNPGNSGGPLVGRNGEVIGINTFILKDGNSIGFSLPANYLKSAIEAFDEVGRVQSTRCFSCSKVVTADTIDRGYCPNCGAKIILPSEIEPYEAAGAAKTIEDLLEKTGHDVELSRRGPNVWEIQQGSALINISYYEKTGLIIGDAFLCRLPTDNIKPLYEYLLRQNFSIEGLTFSVKGQDIVLSLLIYDRYLNVDTGMKLFTYLFEKADFHDNILVETYGAVWRKEGNDDQVK